MPSTGGRPPPIETIAFAWGADEDRQLGVEREAPTSNTPQVIEALLGIQLAGKQALGAEPIVAGSRNTLAIDAEGRVWSWGWNDRGTLGHGHRNKEAKPRRIAALRGVRMKQVSVNGWHCLALSEQGQVYAWGGNEYFQCGVEREQRDVLTPMPCVPHLRVAQVACGGMHSLALTETGEVWTWGEPWGDFSLKVERQPRPVHGATGMAAIAAGAFHNMALSLSGQVYTWGTNDYGQLGNGNTSYQIEPKPVQGIVDAIADICAGGWHSLALSVGGEIWTWGRGEYGRLGIGDRTGSTKLRPKKVIDLEGHTVVQVAAGGTHTIARTSQGRVFIWGRASFGRLGGASEKDLYAPVELQLPGGRDRWHALSIAAGGRHSIALALPLRMREDAAGGAGEARGAAVEEEVLQEVAAARRSEVVQAERNSVDQSRLPPPEVRAPLLAAAAAARPQQQQPDRAEPAPRMHTTGSFEFSSIAGSSDTLMSSSGCLNVDENGITSLLLPSVSPVLSDGSSSPAAGAEAAAAVVVAAPADAAATAAATASEWEAPAGTVVDSPASTAPGRGDFAADTAVADETEHAAAAAAAALAAMPLLPEAAPAGEPTPLLGLLHKVPLLVPIPSSGSNVNLSDELGGQPAGAPEAATDDGYLSLRWQVAAEHERTVAELAAAERTASGPWGPGAAAAVATMGEFEEEEDAEQEMFGVDGRAEEDDERRVAADEDGAEGDTEREMEEEARLRGPSGESEGPADVQGDSDDEGAFGVQQCQGLAMARARAKSPSPPPGSSRWTGGPSSLPGASSEPLMARRSSPHAGRHPSGSPLAYSPRK